MPQDPGPMDDDLLDAVGTAFSRLRRRTGQVVVEPRLSRKDLSRNVLINLVDEGGGRLTVGAVAAHLEVDPSAASRMVSEAVRAGLVTRVADQDDARRTGLALTPAGVGLRDALRAQQRRAFEVITADWPAAERLELVRLLLKYSEATGSLVPPRTAAAPPQAEATARSSG